MIRAAGEDEKTNIHRGLSTWTPTSSGPDNTLVDNKVAHIRSKRARQTGGGRLGGNRPTSWEPHLASSSADSLALTAARPFSMHKLLGSYLISHQTWTTLVNH